MATEAEIRSEFDRYVAQRQGWENKVDGLVAQVMAKSWKDLGKDAAITVVCQALKYVPAVGGGLAWGFEKVASDEPPGQPLAKAITLLALLRQSHESVAKKLGSYKPSAKVMGDLPEWKAMVHNLGIGSIAIKEIGAALDKMQERIDAIKQIINVNYQQGALINDLLQKLIDKEVEGIELATLKAPLKPLGGTKARQIA